MKFITKLIFVALLTISTANAEWVEVASNSDTRVIADADFFRIIKEDDGTLEAMIKIKSIRPNGVYNIVSWVKVRSCNEGYGHVYFMFETKEINKFLWQNEGNKIYDSVAKYICANIDKQGV